MSNPTFLTAEWRKLAMANYVVEPGLLLPFLPAGTELDLWNGRCYLSLVGFMFLNTRIKGFSVPCHANFEEVNLRFYVRYPGPDGWRRGVVFIRELVPRPALTFVANRIYKENYQTLPMRHSWTVTGEGQEISYEWMKKRWHSFTVKTGADATPISEGSEEEFITEHYWGYTKIKPSLISEYEVAHPRWNVYKVLDHTINVDFGLVYGKEFEFLDGLEPASVMLAEGSRIEVKAGSLLRISAQRASVSEL